MARSTGFFTLLLSLSSACATTPAHTPASAQTGQASPPVSGSPTTLVAEAEIAPPLEVADMGNAPATAQPIVLRPARVFDGVAADPHEGWVVVTRGEKIEAAGPAAAVTLPPDARVIDLPGATLMPGLIDAHTHVLLHAYNERSWDDQVLKEPQALRVVRAVNHLHAILDSGFTTIRDLGTEGAGYADVGLRDAIEQGLTQGPRLLASTRAIVATHAYGPSGFAPEVLVPLGAEEADGESLRRVVRDQIGRGADWIKIYADFTPTSPTFTLEELRVAVETAHTQGHPVSVHALSKEGVRNAALAGVDTIEHGSFADAATFRLMRERGIPLVPTLSAVDAIRRYNGWHPGEPLSPKHRQIIDSFKEALRQGVTIVNGSDMGVFPHGQGAHELELMVQYGMTAPDALRAATSVAARALHLDARLGAIKPGLLADIAVFDGDPTKDISILRKVRLVVKGGIVVRE